MTFLPVGVAGRVTRGVEVDWGTGEDVEALGRFTPESDFFAFCTISTVNGGTVHFQFQKLAVGFSNHYSVGCTVDFYN